jgi:hypothetical protein
MHDHVTHQYLEQYEQGIALSRPALSKTPESGQTPDITSIEYAWTTYIGRYLQTRLQS